MLTLYVFVQVCTLSYLLREQDAISEQGGAKFFLVREKKNRVVQNFFLVHEKKVQGGKKLKNS